MASSLAFPSPAQGSPEGLRYTATGARRAAAEGLRYDVDLPAAVAQDFSACLSFRRPLLRDRERDVAARSVRRSRRYHRAAAGARQRREHDVLSSFRFVADRNAVRASWQRAGPQHASAVFVIRAQLAVS